MIAGSGLVWFGLAFWIVGLVMAVLWICLPFAVFGSKALIREAIGEARKANALLQQIAEQNRMLLEQQRRLAAQAGETRPR